MRRSYGILLFVLLAAIIAFGFYRGWFTFNKENAERDKARAVEKLKEGTEKIKEEADKLKQGFQKDADKNKPTDATK